jgi:hypothetical protein
MRFACRRINSLRVLENLIAFYVGGIPASAMTARGQTDCLVMEPRIYDRTQGLFEEHFTAANRTLDGKLDSGITHCDFLPNRSVAYLEAPNRSAEYVISLGSNLRPISQYRGAALDP